MKALSEDRRIVLLVATLIASILGTAILGWLYWRAQSQEQILDDKRQVLTENVG